MALIAMKAEIAEKTGVFMGLRLLGTQSFFSLEENGQRPDGAGLTGGTPQREKMLYMPFFPRRNSPSAPLGGILEEELTHRW